MNDLLQDVTPEEGLSKEDETTTTTTTTTTASVTSIVCGAMSSVPGIYFTILTEKRRASVLPDLQEAMDEGLFDSDHDEVDDAGGSEEDSGEEEDYVEEEDEEEEADDEPKNEENGDPHKGVVMAGEKEAQYRRQGRQAFTESQCMTTELASVGKDKDGWMNIAGRNNVDDGQH